MPRPKTPDPRPPGAGATVRLRKPHPCGGNEFTVVRESVIVTLRCNTCGSVVRMEKEKYNKVLRDKRQEIRKDSSRR